MLLSIQFSLHGSSQKLFFDRHENFSVTRTWFLTTQKFLRRREDFSKARSGCCDRFLPKIILVSLRPFEDLHGLPESAEIPTRHFLAN